MYLFSKGFYQRWKVTILYAVVPKLAVDSPTPCVQSEEQHGYDWLVGWCGHEWWIWICVLCLV